MQKFVVLALVLLSFRALADVKKIQCELSVEYRLFAIPEHRDGRDKVLLAVSSATQTDEIHYQKNYGLISISLPSMEMWEIKNAGERNKKDSEMAALLASFLKDPRFGEVKVQADFFSPHEGLFGGEKEGSWKKGVPAYFEIRGKLNKFREEVIEGEEKLIGKKAHQLVIDPKATNHLFVNKEETSYALFANCEKKGIHFCVEKNRTEHTAFELASFSSFRCETGKKED